MKTLAKFAAILLLCICGIVTANAVWTWDREVAFFENDMRLDHGVLGDAITAVVRSTWVEKGKQQALAVPEAIEHGRRHVALALLDTTDARWAALPSATQDALRAGKATSARTAATQRSLVPIRGPGDELAVLEIEEPLAEERAFSRESLLRSVGAAASFVLLCTVLTLALGYYWFGRPIQALCAGAHRIGLGDLSGDIRTTGNRELALLAAEMNAMCKALAESQRAIAREGERRVAALQQLRHAERLATVGRLAAGIAHELGTPLNVVWAHARMIARGEVAGAEAVEGAATIEGQAERMTKIIRQLLDFARPRNVVKTATPLVPLARQTVGFLTAHAQKRSVALRVTPGGEDEVAHVDGPQIQQVLTNLVMNAIEATPAGGQVEVAVGSERHDEPGGANGDWHRIDVRDTGSGIAPDLLEHLFEPFVTTKGVGEGTGLGLSVACGIVTEHGGRITVRTRVGEGSEFSVLLPRAGP